MKLSNIFKKESKNNLQSKVQSLDKKQLEKVIGGGAINTSRSNIKSPTGLDDTGDTGVTVTGTTGTDGSTSTSYTG